MHWGQVNRCVPLARSFIQGCSGLVIRVISPRLAFDLHAHTLIHYQGSACNQLSLNRVGDLTWFYWNFDLGRFHWHDSECLLISDSEVNVNLKDPEDRDVTTIPTPWRRHKAPAVAVEVKVGKVLASWSWSKKSTANKSDIWQWVELFKWV